MYTNIFIINIKCCVNIIINVSGAYEASFSWGGGGGALTMRALASWEKAHVTVYYENELVTNR